MACEDFGFRMGGVGEGIAGHRCRPRSQAGSPSPVRLIVRRKEHHEGCRKPRTKSAADGEAVIHSVDQHIAGHQEDEISRDRLGSGEAGLFEACGVPL